MRYLTVGEMIEAQNKSIEDERRELEARRKKLQEDEKDLEERERQAGKKDADQPKNEKTPDEPARNDQPKGSSLVDHCFQTAGCHHLRGNPAALANIPTANANPLVEHARKIALYNHGYSRAKHREQPSGASNGHPAG